MYRDIFDTFNQRNSVSFIITNHINNQPQKKKKGDSISENLEGYIYILYLSYDFRYQKILSNNTELANRFPKIYQ